MAILPNLVAYYTLDEASGNAADSSGNGYTLTNNNTTTYAAGFINNGVSGGTTNTNKSLSINSAMGMTGATARTYNFRTKILTAPTSGQQFMLFRHLFGGAADGNYANFAYANNGGTFEVRMPSSPGLASTAYTLTVGTWYNIAVTVPASNTGNLTLYINNVSVLTVANWAQNYALTTNLVLLADHSFADYASAMIDEFSITLGVMSGTDLTTIWNSGYGGSVIAPSPATGSGGSTMDGFDANGYASTWASVRSTVQGDGIGNNWSPTLTFLQIRALRNASGYYDTRIGMSFDTSALPNTSTVQEAELRIWGQSTNFVNANSTAACVVNFAPANPGTYADTDWTNVGTTQYAADINFSSLSQSSYNNFPFNSTGIAAVSKTGITSVGVITALDRTNTAPTSSGNDNIMCFDSTDGTHKPILLSYYTIEVPGLTAIADARIFFL